MRVLLLEDDADLRGAIARRLRSEGFAVDEARDLPDAERLVGWVGFDCLLLDRTLPSGDAIDLVQALRRRHVGTPTLFLTARDTIADRVDGFEAGGDDYLVKPFAIAELVARVRSLCRRAGEIRPPVVSLRGLEIDTARREVRRDGVLLPLRVKERCLLEQLALTPGDVVTRSELIAHCWDEEHDPWSNVVDVHMASLRRKLGEPALIRTVRGEGYVLDAD